MTLYGRQGLRPMPNYSLSPREHNSGWTPLMDTQGSVLSLCNEHCGVTLQWHFLLMVGPTWLEIKDPMIIETTLSYPHSHPLSKCPRCCLLLSAPHLSLLPRFLKRLEHSSFCFKGLNATDYHGGTYYWIWDIMESWECIKPFKSWSLVSSSESLGKNINQIYQMPVVSFKEMISPMPNLHPLNQSYRLCWPSWRVSSWTKLLVLLELIQSWEPDPNWASASCSEHFVGVTGKPPSGTAKPVRYKPGAVCSHLCHGKRSPLKGKVDIKRSRAKSWRQRGKERKKENKVQYPPSPWEHACKQLISEFYPWKIQLN